MKHPIDSRQLLAFVTVAKTQSFTQAGRELCLSQSAVSHAVKALENELGQSVLDRNGKNIRITPAGEHLLHYAQKILTDMSVARVSLEHRSQWGMSRLRLGMNGYFCDAILPEVLKSFLKDFPGWPVKMRPGSTRQCVDWLDQNVIDLAIVVAPSRTEAVQLTPLFTDEVMWIVSPEHPWAKAGIVMANEVESQHYICNSTGSYTSQLLDKYFERDHVRMKCNVEVDSLKVVKEMIKMNAGISALATWAVSKELEEKSLVALPLGKRKLKRNWCLMRSLDRKPTLAEEKFAKLTLEATKGFTSFAGVMMMALTNTLWQMGLFDLDSMSVPI